MAWLDIAGRGCHLGGMPDQIRDGFGCHRLAEVIALDFIAIIVAQEGKLLGGFNALGDDAEIELLPQGNHGGSHGPVAFTAGKIVDERLVNFQSGNGEGFQRVEAGITGAEVINGELNTQALQFLHGLHGLVHILHDKALGDFELQIFGRQSAFAQGVDDAADQGLFP